MLSKAGNLEKQFNTQVLDVADVLTLADLNALEIDQDWEYEETIITLDDYSVLAVGNFTVKEMH